MYNKPNYDLIKIVLLKKHKHGPSAESVFFLFLFYFFFHLTQHILCEDPGSFAAPQSSPVRFNLWMTFNFVLQNFQDSTFRQREQYC